MEKFAEFTFHVRRGIRKREGAGSKDPALK
jgi:hypothetical protein